MSSKSVVVFSSALLLSGALLGVVIVNGNERAPAARQQLLEVRLAELTAALDQGQLSEGEFQRQRRGLLQMARLGQLC